MNLKLLNWHSAHYRNTRNTTGKSLVREQGNTPPNYSGIGLCPSGRDESPKISDQFSLVESENWVCYERSFFSPIMKYDSAPIHFLSDTHDQLEVGNFLMHDGANGGDWLGSL